MSTYCEKLAQLIKAMGQDIACHAEVIAGKDDRLKGLEITLSFPQEGWKDKEYPRMEMVIQRKLYPKRLTYSLRGESIVRTAYKEDFDRF